MSSSSAPNPPQVNAQRSLGNFRRLTIWALVTLMSSAIALYAFTYIGRSIEAAPPPIGENSFPLALMIHILASGVALLLGAWQFVGIVRTRVPRVHRWVGRIYLAACLVGGVSGANAALGSAAGPIAQSGFFALAVFWLVTTSMGWRAALRRDFTAHQEWMIRSFALTFAAVTLRLYLPVPILLGYEFIEGYRVIAWISWVPNLIVAELWLRSRTPVLA